MVMLLYPKILIYSLKSHDHPLPLEKMILDGNENLWRETYVFTSSYITIDGNEENA